MKTINGFIENLLKEFVVKFENELLLALQQRHSYDRNVKSSDCYLKVSDVVIVKDETLPRLSLEKAHFIKLYPGNHDVIRGEYMKHGMLLVQNRG